ncbi:hypothetical protein HETIRDRAFT_455056 [Heterobasidion irregulare TC 32-1]|uniref:PPM-type phosphatase domain-containing protein n=1 Tax=Heterobasidion irregulare (strain TC 32-1) TaxID=747525 RepID=W4JTT1_HETIT|nr:uncharacterized protein HETIRDRAFT_455056 [Heterobasidion irregulare TC 32-1]ETW76515.1 hypothetical protein HETIRDRAFT_455056 [Heterobasidion irregulare TC 32-1]
MSLLDDARKRLTNFYTSTKLVALGIHTVMFQPLQSHISEDRIVTEEWSIQGQHWAFLAVLGGHGGTATVEYAMNELPLQIRTALHLLIQNHSHGRLDRSNEIQRFDTNIGKAVKNLCRKSYKLTEEAALVNVEEKLTWAVGVGDSTVAPLETVIPRIKTPPYLIVEPSVQFIDLRPYWEAKPTIMLFTDGIDCLIDGYFNLTPRRNSGGNPYQIVAALLQDGVDFSERGPAKSALQGFMMLLYECFCVLFC